MFLLKTRRERETVIVQSMIRMYCRSNHIGEGFLCQECTSLTAYASKRSLSCMYGEYKPVCKECPVHCYSPQMREQMRLVMQWAGPRMIYRKPVYAIIHFIDHLMSPSPDRKPVTNTIRKK
jgi:hypothetical protein